MDVTIAPKMLSVALGQTSKKRWQPLYSMLTDTLTTTLKGYTANMLLRKRSHEMVSHVNSLAF